ncbi:hypothetical protein NXV57_18690 [Bacteroides thetaiotaomicron]|nr:hypothetical protein [Bacteroides thetaiotaomicron]
METIKDGAWFAPVLFKKQGNYFISTKALVPNYEESLINEFLLMGISIKACLKSATKVLPIEMELSQYTT